MGSRHGETVQMYIVAIMIELKSTFSHLLGYLLFNYLSLCPQLSCMHCNISPMLLIQGMANDDAIIACSSLAEVGAANHKILYSLLHYAVEAASEIERQSSWDDSGPVTVTGSCRR